MADTLYSKGTDPGLDEQYMFYPAQAEQDPGSLWLRQQLLEIARALPQPVAAKKPRRRR